MEEEIKNPVPQEEGYVPRPRWQVWAARIALAIFLAGLFMYYCNLFGAAG